MLPTALDMGEASGQRWRRKERTLLKAFEHTRIRSRAKVPGRGRGRPPLTNAERAVREERKRCAKAEQEQRAELRAREQAGQRQCEKARRLEL